MLRRWPAIGCQCQTLDRGAGLLLGEQGITRTREEAARPGRALVVRAWRGSQAMQERNLLWLDLASRATAVGLHGLFSSYFGLAIGP